MSKKTKDYKDTEGQKNKFVNSAWSL